MFELLTCVQIAFYPEHLNNWLRFGDPIHAIDLDRRRSLAFFCPGQIFGYVRWSSNEYGTQEWHFVIVKAVKSPEKVNRIWGILPGAELLLSASGNAKVKRVLSQIDILENDGFDPSDVSPNFYRHVHNRTMVTHSVRRYSAAQQGAFEAMKAVLQ